MREQAVRYVSAGLSAPSGEPITTNSELPDDLDDLLALSNAMTEIVSVAYQLRNEVDAKAADLLGPGKWYEYGEQQVRWSHGWSWKADKEAVEKFIRDLADTAPDELVGLFNPNDIRKTGVEKAARALGLEPETVVDTLLYRKWKNEPGLQWKPIDK